MLPAGTLLWGSDEPFAAGRPHEVLGQAPEDLREGLAFANAGETFTSLQRVAA